MADTHLFAGVFPSRMQTTEDGFEQTWAVNVLALYALNALLVKHVSERIINVSSISADSHIDFHNLQQARVTCIACQ
jgi:NAD(P)-dependent dehydrogenase (short-subunit alcohol dehydrogenase family)